jgi:hypothetical protein
MCTACTENIRPGKHLFNLCTKQGLLHTPAGLAVTIIEELNLRWCSFTKVLRIYLKMYCTALLHTTSLLTWKCLGQFYDQTALPSGKEPPVHIK